LYQNKFDIRTKKEYDRVTVRWLHFEGDQSARTLHPCPVTKLFMQ